MKNLLFTLLGSLFSIALFSQNADWVDLMNDPNANFYDIKQEFDEYWKEREVEKGKGHKQFMRWAHFWEPRVYPEGNFPNMAILGQQFEQLQNNEAINLGLWKPLGPFDGSGFGPNSNSSVKSMGIGRVNRVIFHPINPQIVFACTPAGGLWKSIDGGVTWETNTDLLTNLGASDLAINPLNPDVMYLATGDRDGGDTYSYGILKTTDGGASWKSTGLSFGVSFSIRAQNVYVSPADTSVVLAATRAGMYRSVDGGANFTRVASGAYNNLVQKVGNPNVIFSSSISGSNCQIYMSTDAGISWNLVSDPSLPTSDSRRIELAVTPADTNYVYAVIGANNNGLKGVYRSTDGGTTWSQVDNGSRNLLGWNTNGSDQGGQAWYDLAIAVSPTNKNEVFVGGVNIWTSTNGGVSWSLAAHWFGGGGAPFVHADIHHLTYQPGTEFLYTGTDGGVYRDQPTQFAWDELNDGMNITQYYKLSAGTTDTLVILAGAQDNGTHRHNAVGWRSQRGGDGMDNAVHPRNPNVMYAASQYGNFAKSVNGGGNFNANFNLPQGVNGSGGWVTPIKLDPLYPDTVYIGYDRLYRSYNGGASFSTASPLGMTGSRDIEVVAVSPDHTEVLYISVGNDLWRTSNRGNSWSNLSANVPGSNAITDIAVDFNDPSHVFITRSGYSSSSKVFESFDGGMTWTSISNGLPNVPANCIVLQNNPERSMYVGTDLGVFYRDSVNPTWIAFNAGLPNVIVNELEINYGNRKLRAATYGRGIWETPLYSDLIPPRAAAVFPQVVCIGDSVQLFDNSDYNPDRFRWYIEPANYSFVNGTNDTMAAPWVVFSQSGFYNISLVASNPIGSDSAYFASAVVAGGLPLPFLDDLNLPEDYTRWDYEDNGSGWEAVPTSLGTSFRANLYNNTATGTHYDLTSPAVNLTGHDSASLSFDYAYSGTSANTGDSLLIYAAGSCTDNWVLLASLGEDGNGNFVTSGPVNTAFDPAATDWCGNALAGCVEVSLHAFSGQEGVRVKFVAVNAGGNHLYLDNIEITAKPLSAPVAGFSSVSSVCAMDSISFLDQSYGSPDTYEWTFTGPTTLNSGDRHPRMLFTQAGLYDVKLKISNVNGADSVIQTGYLNVDPADSVTLSLTAAFDSICPGDDLSFSAMATNAGSDPDLDWYVNGQLVSSGSDMTVDLKNLSDGDQVYVVLRSSLQCAFPDVLTSNTITVHTYPVIVPQINLPSLMCTTDTAVVLTATPAGGTFSGNGVVNGSTFDPAVAGTGSSAITYTVTATSGCTFSATQFVGVTKPITLSTSGNARSCEDGAPVSLNVGQPAGGLYSGPGVHNNMFYPDSVTGTGTYSLTYSYFSTICGTSSVNFDMTVNAAPASPGIIVHKTYLECDVTASGYQWYDSTGAISGATAKTFSPSQDGEYRVEITDNNSCSSISEASGYYIGIKDLPAGFEFSLFPNPATEVLNLDLRTVASHDLSIRLYDQVGNLVLQRAVSVNGSALERINLAGLAAGVYLFTLEGDQVNVVRQVIIE